jgi:hypothetical protein
MPLTLSVGRKYCTRCIHNCYRDEYEAKAAAGGSAVSRGTAVPVAYSCPRCRGICCCSECKKNKVDAVPAMVAIPPAKRSRVTVCAPALAAAVHVRASQTSTLGLGAAAVNLAPVSPNPRNKPVLSTFAMAAAPPNPPPPPPRGKRDRPTLVDAVGMTDGPSPATATVATATGYDQMEVLHHLQLLPPQLATQPSGCQEQTKAMATPLYRRSPSPAPSPRSMCLSLPAPSSPRAMFVSTLPLPQLRLESSVTLAGAVWLAARALRSADSDGSDGDIDIGAVEFGVGDVGAV